VHPKSETKNQVNQVTVPDFGPSSQPEQAESSGARSRKEQQDVTKAWDITEEEFSNTNHRTQIQGHLFPLSPFQIAGQEIGKEVNVPEFK
jgi:hypothetical protein